MKKRILLFALAVAMPIGSIFAQMTYNHWSIQGKGGISTIRGLNNSAFDRDYSAEYGGAIEYTFTPVVGIGIEYLYQNNDHPSYDFTSNIQQATIFSSVNLSNLTVQFRKDFWKGFNVYWNVGGGLGFGSYENSSTITSTTDPNGDIMNLSVYTGINFEYNLGKSLAFGIEPQFRWNSNGYYNPIKYQKTKDFYTVNFNLRYKITGSKMHIRNQNYVDYQLDQIANWEHQQRQEASVNSKMQELLIEQAKREAFVKDSLVKDSLITDSIAKVTALEKRNVEDGVYFKKVGQNAGNQNMADLNDTIQGVQADVEQNIYQTQVEQVPVEQVIEQTDTKTPMIEPIVSETSENALYSKQPVSMKTETYENTELKRYNIVVGSFSNKENANNLSSKLLAEGSETYVVQNEQGMYRVIALTTNGIDSAVSQVKKMRKDYPDAWILVLK